MSVPVTNRPKDKTTVLQSKLYRAAVGNRARRFHALHDKLYLPYVMRQAWELVRRNRGAGGIDGQTLADIEAYGVERFLEETAQAVREQTYRPVPVRRVYIPKRDGSTRPLGIPTVRDRVVQAAAKLILEPIFEADFEGCSFGFQPGRGPQEALEAVLQQARKGFRWVVDADIERFFDRLDHQVLMAALRRRIGDGAMLRLIWRWLRAGYLWEGKRHDTDQGSPQGGVLSPLLANVYLHAFDQAAREQKTFLGKLTRYADDFVIQCGSEEQARRALAWATAQLAALKLRLHPTKTRIVNDREEGFDFLGFHHRRVVLQSHSRKAGGRESKGVLRWPSRKAQASFRERIRQGVGPPGRLRAHWSEVVKWLRGYLTGWCQYYRHGESRVVFAKLDRYVRERVARTATRAQPRGKKRRPRHWIEYSRWVEDRRDFPRLVDLQKSAFRDYRGQANAQWRAV